MFIVNTWRGRGVGGSGKTLARGFPRWETVNTLFYSDPVYKSLHALCCPEARYQSYQTLVCNSIYLTNARNLPLFLLHPSFTTFLQASLLSLLVFLSFYFYKSERRDLLGTRVGGRGWEAGAPRPNTGAQELNIGPSTWALPAPLGPAIFILRVSIQNSTESSGTNAQRPAFLPRPV